MADPLIDSEDALQMIADALGRLALIAEKFYDAAYPVKPHVRDATLTNRHTREQEAREKVMQGITGPPEESLEDWKDLGPRERAFVKESAASSRPGTGSGKKAGSGPGQDS